MAGNMPLGAPSPQDASSKYLPFKGLVLDPLLGESNVSDRVSDLDKPLHQQSTYSPLPDGSSAMGLSQYGDWTMNDESNNYLNFAFDLGLTGFANNVGDLQGPQSTARARDKTHTPFPQLPINQYQQTPPPGFNFFDFRSGLDLGIDKGMEFVHFGATNVKAASFENAASSSGAPPASASPVARSRDTTAQITTTPALRNFRPSDSAAMGSPASSTSNSYGSFSSAGSGQAVLPSTIFTSNMTSAGNNAVQTTHNIVPLTFKSARPVTAKASPHPLWQPGTPLTASEKASFKAVQKALKAGQSPESAYGAAMVDIVSCAVGVPTGVEITMKEILTFLPNHIQLPRVAVRILLAGWPREALVKAIAEPRGGLATLHDLRKRESTHQHQFQDGWDACVEKIKYSKRNGTVAQQASIVQCPVDMTFNECAPRATYTTTDKAQRAEDNKHDCLLRVMAENVDVSKFPTGSDAGPLTWCITYALQHPDQDLLFSEVPAIVKHFKLTFMLQDGVNNPDSAGIRDATRIANPTVLGGALPPPAGVKRKGNTRTGEYSKEARRARH